ncbi:hypothetical protein Tco_1546024 [Tanacetum coccineum]
MRLDVLESRLQGLSRDESPMAISFMVTTNLWSHLRIPGFSFDYLRTVIKVEDLERYEEELARIYFVKEGVVPKWLVRSYKKQFDGCMEIKKQWVTRGIDTDMEYDPSDTRGDDEVELTDEEFSNLDNENLIDKDEVAEILMIETDIFDFETDDIK